MKPVNDILTSTKRAVIYTRVSTEDQAEHGTSLAGQQTVCRKKADQLGLEVVGHFEDAGVSGGLYEARSQFQAALRALENGDADTLIVANLSRFSRDREHQSSIKKRIEAAGAHVVFCDMNFDETPEGDLAFGIMGTFADYERKLFRKRSMTGRRRRAEEGQQPSRSQSPYGYHIVTKPDVMHGRYPQSLLGSYQIIEEQQAVVLQIFTRYAEGVSLTGLCCELQDQGVPTPRGAKFWNASSLRRILSNPVYKGKPVYGRSHARLDEGRARTGLNVSYVVPADEADWIYLDAPAIVETSLFELCKQRLAEGIQYRAGNPARIHTLSGLLRCPICMKGMRGKWTERTYKNKQLSRVDHYYHCRLSSPCTNAAKIVCNTKSYSASSMEELTCHALGAVARHPVMIETAIRAYERQDEQENPLQEKTRLTQELKSLGTKEKAAIEAQVAGIMAGVSPAAYAPILKDIGIQREALEARLRQLSIRATKQPKANEAGLLASILADLEEALHSEEITPAERRALLGRVIDTIVPRNNEAGEPAITIGLRSGLPMGKEGKFIQMLYKVNVTFQGSATLEIEADTPDAARLAAAELTPADLARQGHADILAFKIAAREVTPASALGGQHEEAQAENAPRKPRPSGWYRPH